jgi:hypothetical protein
MNEQCQIEFEVAVRILYRMQLIVLSFCTCRLYQCAEYVRSLEDQYGRKYRPLWKCL